MAIIFSINRLLRRKLLVMTFQSPKKDAVSILRTVSKRKDKILKWIFNKNLQI